MKNTFKLLVTLVSILTLMSCTKEVIIPVDECQCTKTNYKSRQYTVVRNGLPSIFYRKERIGIERGLGCQPEGVTSLGNGLSYEIICTN